MADRRAGGQITIYLSLVLMLVLSLVFTCLESARAGGLRMRFRLASEIAAESVFAQYDRLLWDDYGLLYFADADGRGAEAASIAEQYLRANAGINGSYLSSGADWLRLMSAQAGITDLVLATDQNGDVFRQSVCRYMRSCGLEEMLIEWMQGMDPMGTGSILPDTSGIPVTDPGALLGQSDMLEQSILQAEQLDSAPEEEAQEGSEEAPGSRSDVEESQEADVESVGDGSGLLSTEELEARRRSLKDVMEIVRRWYTDGLLSLVVEDVSAYSAEAYDMSDLPSGLPYEQKSRSRVQPSEPGLADRVLFMEYNIRKLDCAVSEGRSCGVEYVISGAGSDRDSLAAVAGKLFGVRLALDLVYLVSECPQKEEARELAAFIIGWTGEVVLVEALLALILTVWAVAEAISDVRALLKGRRVPLLKDADSWRTSGANLLGEEPADSEGWSYEHYLRAFLLMADQTEITYRTMDVIQRNIMKSEPGFRMSSCIYAARFSCTGRAQTMFPMLPGHAAYSFSEDITRGCGELTGWLDPQT